MPLRIIHMNGALPLPVSGLVALYDDASNVRYGICGGAHKPH